MRTFIMIALVLVGAGTVSAQQPAVYNFSSPVQSYPAGYAPQPTAMQPGMVATGVPMNPAATTPAPQPAYFNNAAGCDASGCDASGCDASGCANGGCDANGNVWNGGRRFGFGNGFGNGNGGCDGGNCGAGGCDSGNCGAGGGGLLGGGMLGGLFNRCNGVGGASGCGVYHSLFGGLTSPNNLSFDSDPAFDLDLKRGWMIGRAWGRQINCNWRAEFETSYRSNSASDFELSDATLGLSNGRLNVMSGMVNVIRDFRPMGRNDQIRPYAGVGAGVAFVDLEATLPGAPATFFDSRDSTFAYQFIAGVSHKIRNCVDLYGEYRYYGMDKFCVETTPLNSPTSCDEALLSQHNFLFGMRVWVR
jgi:opacity protein-like surface antigen